MTTWGAAQADSTNAFRIGYDITMSPATPTASTPSVTLTLKPRLGTKYFANDSSVDWTVTGGFSPSSGSSAFDHNSGTAWSSSNETQLGTVTRTVPLSYTSTTTVSFTASATGLAAIAGTATVSGSFTVPKRPVSAPAAPTGCSHTRTSDTQHTVTWSNTSPTNPAAPYGNLQVERQTDGGAWARLATIGVVTSYVDKGTVANRKYRYRVRAVNGSLASAYSTDAEFMTTPAAPSNVSAKKNAAGAIEVRWTDNSSWNTHFEVWHAADGVWDAAPLATVLNGVQPYVDSAPSASVTHTYRVRSKTTTPVLLSAYSAASNVVALQAPPNAPTPIAPVSVAVDANDTIVFQWQHNPTDTTDQRQYEFQYRVNGGAWSSSGIIASSTQGGVIAGGTLTNGQTLEWQVRTWGDHANPSPWSTVAVVPLSTKPTVLVNSPEVGVPYGSSTVTATWGYSDEEANPQARWQATLYNAAGNAVETLTGSGAASSATFTTPVTDGGEYATGVKAQDSTGVWSSEDTVVFVVQFAKPPVPQLLLEWIPDSAAIAVSVTNPPTSVGEADVATVSVWRSVNGADWVLIADQMDPNSSTTDFIPGLGVVNYYKAVARSALPSVSESLVEELVTDQACAVWVNAGPGFSQAVRLASNVKVDDAPSRARTLRRASGLDYPLENSGRQRNQALSVSATLWSPQSSSAAASSTWEELKELADQIAPACYRDPEGARVFVSLGDPTLGDKLAIARSLSWTLTRVNYREPTGEAIA